MEISLREQIENLIQEKFSFLEAECLYAVRSLEGEQSTLLNDIASIEYTSVLKRRTINITCTYANHFDEPRYSFSLGISRDPYSGYMDYLSLGTYLNMNGASKSQIISGSFDIRKADSILSHMSKVLATELHGVIMGELWLEEYYPRRD